jgi:hypothetical protein
MSRGHLPIRMSRTGNTDNPVVGSMHTAPLPHTDQNERVLGPARRGSTYVSKNTTRHQSSSQHGSVEIPPETTDIGEKLDHGVECRRVLNHTLRVFWGPV